MNNGHKAVTIKLEPKDGMLFLLPGPCVYNVETQISTGYFLCQLMCDGISVVPAAKRFAQFIEQQHIIFSLHNMNSEH